MQLFLEATMKAYAKEILISSLALLILLAAVWGYIRSTKIQQSNTRIDIYTVIPPDANALVAVNRPSVFNRMLLENQALYDIFVSQIPPLFLSFVRESRFLQSVTFSFHPQGVICYVQAGDEWESAVKKKLESHFSAYKPVKTKADGIAFYYYPDAGSRFLGCFTHKGVWVGSYSKKLLEKVAGQQVNPAVSFPGDMKRLRYSFDANAPLNIIFPTKDLNLYVSSARGTPGWRITDRWLAADLFLSEGNICCYGFLPYEPDKPLAMYQSMGDTISARIRNLYAPVRLSFQVNREGAWAYYTGCAPAGK
ncbi:MAG: hypothetical protein LBJ60_00240 [Tannerellaceae bacterium]|nr:hypothetical protein [Tannerellaceae bacterium]